jgi:muramoyltetrapeptide carboxypeptidase
MTSPRTSAGYLKVRPVAPGSRVALVAPASSFDRAEFDRGVAELQRLGLEPVFDDDVFDKQVFTAGTPLVRAHALQRALARPDVDAVIAVRGGYGSVEVLPMLDAGSIRQRRTAFIGYSDVTSVHSWLGAEVGLASIHGVMLDGRLARGEAAYDRASFFRTLTAEPLGELAPDGLETLVPGTAEGPLVGGTLTNLLASFETPFAFRPPPGHVLLLDEVGERPYRLHRMLTQYRLTGRLAYARAIVFGQLPRCDEPGGRATARDVVREVLAGFSGPVLFGFPSGHTTTPLVSLPFGVHARVVANERPRLVVDEAAAA